MQRCNSLAGRAATARRRARPMPVYYEVFGVRVSEDTFRCGSTAVALPCLALLVWFSYALLTRPFGAAEAAEVLSLHAPQSEDDMHLG